MLLTGDPGTGKTVSLRRFVDSLNDNLFRAVYTPLTTLRSADLLRHINDKFDDKRSVDANIVLRVKASAG